MDWKQWVKDKGIGIAIAAVAGIVGTLAVTHKPNTAPTPEAATQTVVYYSGHLDSAFHPACQDATGNVLPCTGVPQKAHLTWAIAWLYGSGAGHGIKYYDWDHIVFNPAAHCGTGDIVEKWTYGVDQHKCACVLTGVTLACTQGVPKPVQP